MQKKQFINASIALAILTFSTISGYYVATHQNDAFYENEKKLIQSEKEKVILTKTDDNSQNKKDNLSFPEKNYLKIKTIIFGAFNKN